MEFITILACLAIERWTTFGKQFRGFSLFTLYLKLFTRVKMADYLGLAIILVPLTLVIGLVYWWLLHVWFGIFAFLFSIVILLYCLGEFESNQNTEAENIEHTEEHNQEIATLLVRANHNIFAVLFWYVLLGPMGAVLYRLNDLLSHHTNNELAEYSFAAKTFERLLDWIPVRLFAFSIALVSHFVSVFKCWLSDVLTGFQQNDAVLANCGVAALKEEGSTSKLIRAQVLTLIDRALIVWLVIMALIILL